MKLETRASALATLTGGVLHGVDRAILEVSTLESATEHSLAWHERGDPGRAGVLICRAPLDGRTCVVVADPLGALITVLENHFPEIHPEPVTPHPSARLGVGVVLYPGVYVGPDCEVGDGTVLFPNVVLYRGTRLGRRCRIHAGCVVGADGFRYHTDGRKVPQLAGVRVGDGVEMGANCTIDRGFLEDTIIGAGSKLDDQVHVGHNVRLGRGVVIAAQTGISGSVRVGDGVLIGGQVGVADHADIGDGARIGAQSGVHGKIPAGEAWLGTPAQPLALMRRIYATMRYLPQMWAKG